MTSRNDELLRQGPHEAPEPLTAEERSSRSRAGGAALGGAAIGAGLAKWALGATAGPALGTWAVGALVGVLAALIVGDAVHRAWLAVRGRRP
jgi:hypothetical protein